MGTYKEAEFYNLAFFEREEYRKPYDKCIYCPIWKNIFSIINPFVKSTKILELGCGPGQFAKMLYDNYPQISYLGVDFSPEGIEMSKALCPNLSFMKMNIEESPILPYNDFNLIIALEVMEHLKDDTSIFKWLKKYIPFGAKMIFTVPDFDSEAHVRLFHSEAEIIEHYKSFISIATISRMNVGRGDIYICFGVLL